jgi:RNA 2',3'-cyclic 3'-phosphodiesterase
VTEAAANARLFVALTLPAEVRAALSDWAAAQAAAEPGPLRVLATDSLHVTLCFLGARPVAEVGEIAAACLAVAGSGAVTLRLGEPLWLPPRRPGVLAVSLLDRDCALARVQATLAEALAAGGFYRPERRAYLGHVTVARVRRGARVGASLPPALFGLASTGGFEADKVELMRSELSRAGARYESLAGVKLRP